MIHWVMQKLDKERCIQTIDATGSEGWASTALGSVDLPSECSPALAVGGKIGRWHNGQYSWLRPYHESRHC